MTCWECNMEHPHHHPLCCFAEECEPCYCGWRGIDSDGCTCFSDRGDDV